MIPASIAHLSSIGVTIKQKSIISINIPITSTYIRKIVYVSAFNSTARANSLGNHINIFTQIHHFFPISNTE